MGISIYYQASRSQPLSAEEDAAVREIIERHSVDGRRVRFCEAGVGSYWEDFCLYDPPFVGPATILQGATRLPDETLEVFWEGTQHWCHVLAEIRRAVPGADWSVHIDDRELEWDEERREYDLSD